MTASTGRPTHLVFDHDPSPAELTRELFAPVLTARVRCVEDDEQLRVVSAPLPFRRLVAAVLFMCVGITVAPWAIAWSVDREPPRFSMLHGVCLSIVWIGVMPWLLRRLARARDDVAMRQPGLIFDKRTRKLTLPWLGRTVACAQVLRLVELRAHRRRAAGAVSYRQLSVLFRDDDGTITCASFARVATPNGAGRTIQRLAEHLDVPIQTNVRNPVHVVGF